MKMTFVHIQLMVLFRIDSTFNARSPSSSSLSYQLWVLPSKSLHPKSVFEGSTVIIMINILIMMKIMMMMVMLIMIMMVVLMLHCTPDRLMKR